MSSREIVVKLRAETAAYEAAMLRASAATKGVATSATAAAKTATAANTGLGKSAAATAVGMKAASNGMSGVANAARGTSGSISALGSGMAVASANAGRLGSGMKTAASNTAGVNSAVRGASGSITALGSGMAAAGASAARASGGLKGVGGAAAAAGAGATRASGGLKALGGNASSAAAAATAASGGLRGMGGAASAAGAGAAAASGGLKRVGGAASAAAAGAASAKGSLDGVGSAAKGASSNATAAASGFGRLSGSIRENNDAWGDLSTKAMIGGAAIVGGLGLATKAAISWESAWAGVQKTTDGSAAQMAKLEGELRQLATTLPASHQEIAAVAEAAGQLGIQRENVASFTKTMIDMGESTNLSAEDAATAIARFSNVMGTAQTDVDKIGSAIVGLGNNFATTESEIMEMSLRLTGAGRQANMTEGDILGIATAMSSVGIEAQAGGTAMSRVITEMGKSVDTGNDKLETFAKTAGMSSEAFSKLWRENSGEAMQRFIQGLGQMQARGESLEPTLQALGMTDIRVGDALRRSASAADQFGDSMAMGNKEFDKGTALAAEAAQRYATTESRMRIAMNSIKDAAIDMGSVIGPALARVAEGAAGMANAFAQLPGPVRSVITGIAGVSGATLLIGGATVKAISGMQSLRSTLDSVGMLTPRVERGFTAVSKAVVGLGVAFVGLQVAGRVLSAFEGDMQRIGSQQLARDIMSTGDSVGTLDKHIKGMATGKNDVVDLDSALKSAFEPSKFEKFGNGMDSALSAFGVNKRGGIYHAKEVLKDLDKTMADMVSGGNTEGAKRMFDQIAEAAKQQGISVEELKKKFPQYAEALAGAENAGAGLEEGMGGIEDGAESAADAVADLSDEIKGLGETFLNERQASRDFEAAMDEMAESIKENGRAWDESTPKGRANQEAMEAIATAARDSAAAIFEQTGSTEKAEAALEKGRKGLDQYASQVNVSSGEVRDLKDNILQIPDDAKTEFEAKNADVAKQGAADFKAMVTGIPSDKRTNISAPGASESKAKVLDLGTSITNLDGKTVKVTEDGAQSSQVRVRELDGTLVGLPSSKKVQVTEIGSTKAGEMVVQFKDKVFAIPKSKTTQIREEGSGASKARVMGFNESIKLLSGKTVKVGEDGAQKAKGRVVQLDGSIFGLKGKTVKVEEIGANASGDRVVRFDGKIYTLKGKTVEVKESGADPSRSRVDMLRNAIGSVYGKNTDVRANVHGKWDVDGLRNSIQATNSKTVTVTAVRRIKNMFADGGLLEGGVQTFADGGFASIGSQRPQIRAAGGKGITWAEDGAGPWEAFISGHPAKSARSKQIWLETGRRLGMIEAHADGAVRQYAKPAPPVRQYVPPAPRMPAAAPVAASVASGPSAAEMQAAFASAMSTMRPVVQIGGRDFYGVMQRTANDRKGRG